MCLSVAFSIYAQTGYDGFSTEENTIGDTSYFLMKQPAGNLHWVQRNIPVDQVKSLKKDDAFWYADKEFADKEKPPQKGKMTKPYIPLGQRTWFQTLLWLVIIGGFAAALIWFLAGSQVRLFRKEEKKNVSSPDDELNTDNIFSINYLHEIDKAARLGNFRLAIRLMYLRLLKEMAEKNIIIYQQDKTNSAYLLQLQSTGYYTDFFRVTRNYEYAWYGLFEIEEATYKIIKNDFEKIENRLL